MMKFSQNNTQESIKDLEEQASRDHEIYIEMLKKKIALEKVFGNESLSDKERAEAGSKLFGVTESFYKFEQQYAYNLKKLESRLLESVSPLTASKEYTSATAETSVRNRSTNKNSMQ